MVQMATSGLVQITCLSRFEVVKNAVTSLQDNFFS